MEINTIFSSKTDKVLLRINLNCTYMLHHNTKPAHAQSLLYQLLMFEYFHFSGQALYLTLLQYLLFLSVSCFLHFPECLLTTAKNRCKITLLTCPCWVYGACRSILTGFVAVLCSGLKPLWDGYVCVTSSPVDLSTFDCWC